MTSYNETVKTILADVVKFLTETLKKEQLSSKSLEHKKQIHEKILSLYNVYPQLKGSLAVDSDESRNTGGSSATDEGEDSPYADDEKLPVISADDITDPIHKGFLEKKSPRNILKKFQKRWCVIKGNIFYYFEKQNSSKQQGAFSLTKFKLQIPESKESQKKGTYFNLVPVSESNGQIRIFEFQAGSKDEAEQWKKAIESVLSASIPDQDSLYEAPGEEPGKSLATTVSEQQDEDNIYEVTDDFISEVQNAEEPKPISPQEDDTYEDGSSVPTTSTARKEEVSSPLVPNRPAAKETTPTVPSLPARRAPPSIPLPQMPSPSPAKPKLRRVQIQISHKPEEDFENKYYGKWDCEAGNLQELSFKRGDMIYIISREFDEKAWWVGELKGKFGLVPKDFLMPAYELVK
ncbi:hypothetical protein CHS0354_025795 [Potamilus streckersoni]|uniref:Src kinase-associated phosphoprotein 2 n=1 Tax=Potamilus streckersoni TaxID=2493646 RepID=A0AAE0TBX7_9BIVA|nr:hypothetical protein CHS0354_025795 [Potamilus streckersoni]